MDNQRDDFNILINPITSPVNVAEALVVSGKMTSLPPTNSGVFLYYALVENPMNYSQFNANGIPITQNMFSTSIPKNTFSNNKSYQIIASYQSTIQKARIDPFQGTVTFSIGSNDSN